MDIGLTPGDLVLPGEIYRFAAHGDRFLFCFMTELGVPAAERAIAEALATTKRCDGRPGGEAAGEAPRRVGFHSDPVTELTAIHSMCRRGDEQSVGRLMARLLEVCVAAEAMAELGTIAPGPRP